MSYPSQDRELYGKIKMTKAKTSSSKLEEGRWFTANFARAVTYTIIVLMVKLSGGDDLWFPITTGFIMLLGKD